MSESDRRTVLADIRRALSHRETVRPTPLESFDQTMAAEAQSDLVTRFARELMAVGGRVYEARDAEELGACVTEICERAAVREVALSGAPLLAEMNLGSQLAMRHFTVKEMARLEDQGREEVVAHLARCEVGVTAADYAIAESGTLVLSSHESHALLVSLLPPIHIAVLRPRQISLSLAEVIAQMKTEQMGGMEPCQTATFITGPSRTGDIELTLSVGVHGPKEIHVIILHE